MDVKIKSDQIMQRPVIGVGTFSASPLAKQLVMEVLDNNRLSYGPMLSQFELNFARLHGSKFAVMSNSGTSALQLALQALKEIHGWSDGDEVIVPALTFVATANIVLHNRMKPVLVDVDPIYYGLDPLKLEEKISSKTRAIIPVHLFGQAADMDPILAIAKKHSLKIIEDSAETMFASYKGRRVGSLGDIACFSTYVAHLLVTGVGGLNTTNDQEYAIKIRSLLNHGRDSIYFNIDDDDGKTIEELIPIIERRFRFTSIGHSFRVTEMEGALGLAQLETWQPDIKRRRGNADYLNQSLKKFAAELQLPAIRPECDHSFMMFPIVMRNENKQRIVNFLEANGIETRDMLPLTNQPVYERLLGWKESNYPVAQWVNTNGFYIGCHQNLSEGDLEYVVHCFDAFFKGTSEQTLSAASLVVIVSDDSQITTMTDLAPIFDLFSQTIFFFTGSNQHQLALLSQAGRVVIQGKEEELFNELQQNPIFVQDEVVLFPLDGKWNPLDIPKIRMMLSRGFDLVIASRFIIGGQRQGTRGNLRSLGNRFYNLLTNIIFSSNLSDAFSSFRGFRRSKLRDAKISGSGLSAMFSQSLQAVKWQWKIHELPTTEITKSNWDISKDFSSAIPSAWFLLKESWSRKS